MNCFIWHWTDKQIKYFCVWRWIKMREKKQQFCSYFVDCVFLGYFVTFYPTPVMNFAFSSNAAKQAIFSCFLEFWIFSILTMAFIILNYVFWTGDKLSDYFRYFNSCFFVVVVVVLFFCTLSICNYWAVLINSRGFPR